MIPVALSFANQLEMLEAASLRDLLIFGYLRLPFLIFN